MKTSVWLHPERNERVAVGQVNDSIWVEIGERDCITPESADQADEIARAFTECAKRMRAIAKLPEEG